MRHFVFLLIIILLAGCREDKGTIPADPDYRLLRADYLINNDTIFLASWEYRPDGRLGKEYYTNRLTGTPQHQTIEYTYFADSVLAVSTTVTATDIIVTRYTILFNAQQYITSIRSYNEPTASTILYDFDRDAMNRLEQVYSATFSFVYSDRFIYGPAISQYSRYFPSLVVPGKTDTADVVFTYNNSIPYRPVISPVEVLPFTTPSPYHQPFSLELCGLRTNPDPAFMVSSINYLQLFGSDIEVSFDYVTDEKGRVISKVIGTSLIPGESITAFYGYEEY